MAEMEKVVMFFVVIDDVASLFDFNTALMPFRPLNDDVVFQTYFLEEQNVR